MQIAAIYGYAISKAIDLGPARIEPIPMAQADLWALAQDLQTFHLTAYVIGDDLPSKFIFNLSAVLSFIERMDVHVADPIFRDEFNQAEWPMQTEARFRHKGGGAKLPMDSLFPDSRATFIRLALARLTDLEECEKSGFDKLFHKYVEAGRQRRPFIEVMWFLLFSGLEDYSRRQQNDYGPNVTAPIANTLKDLGFAICENNAKVLARSVATYTQLRNALFHNGRHEVEVNVNNKVVTLRLSDYLFHLDQLVALAILRIVGFDDGHINWDSWFDRQPFK
jgi:hypothetical protein